MRRAFLMAGFFCFLWTLISTAQPIPESKTDKESTLPKQLQDKLPIPDEASLVQARKLFDDVFKEEYNNAKDIADLQSLAKVILQKGIDSKDGPATQFVLLCQARDIAARACDGPLAFKAVDELDRIFAIDAMAMKGETLKQLSKAARTPDSRKAVVEQSLEVAKEACASEIFAVADDIVKFMASEAAKIKDKPLIQKVQTCRKYVDNARKSYVQLETAKGILKDNPDDPDANLAVGRYLCFIKDNWEEGLDYLAKGNNKKLNKLAVEEKNNPAETDAQVALADDWWEQAQLEQDYSKGIILYHAGQWYTKALPKLSGMMKLKVEKRLKINEVERSDISPEVTESDVKANGTVTISSQEKKQPIKGALVVVYDVGQNSIVAQGITQQDGKLHLNINPNAKYDLIAFSKEYQFKIKRDVRLDQMLNLMLLPMPKGLFNSVVNGSGISLFDQEEKDIQVGSTYGDATSCDFRCMNVQCLIGFDKPTLTTIQRCNTGQSFVVKKGNKSAKCDQLWHLPSGFLIQYQIIGLSQIDAKSKSLENNLVDTDITHLSGKEIPKKIDTELRLERAHGPYKLTDVIVITPSGKLIIERGATVFCAPGAKIVVEGDIGSFGDENQFVMFRPALRDKTWNSISLAQKDKRIVLDRFDVRGAEFGININGGPVEARNCIFTQNTYGVRVTYSGQGGRSFVNCLIIKNIKDGLRWERDKLFFDRCTVSDNGEVGMSMVYYGHASIKNSVISGNATGIKTNQYDSEVDMTSCNIMGNHVAIDVNTKQELFCFNGYGTNPYQS
jgi:hypothetical protein